MTRPLTAALIVASLALLLSACGSSSSHKSTPPPTVVSSAAARSAKLRGAKILVDSKGFALYAFSKDPLNTFHPRCQGRCAASWPPLILTAGAAPVASGQALLSQLGAVKLPGGSLQIAYAGHPLYTYAGDRKPGEAEGNGLGSFGGVWRALSPSGRPASG